MGEVENYLLKAEKKLKHSKIIYDVGGYGDSVSLAYYAMFITAKALLIKKNCKVGKSHVGLIKQFSLKYVHEDDFDYTIYSYLADTQSLRENADYDDVDNIGKKIAKQRIIQAEKFITEAKRFI